MDSQAVWSYIDEAVQVRVSTSNPDAVLVGVWTGVALSRQASARAKDVERVCETRPEVEHCEPLNEHREMWLKVHVDVQLPAQRY